MAKILVVDDDRALLTMIELILQRSGHSITLAASAAEALEHTANQPVDLAVIDVMMPEMDGFELTERLRADARTKDLRILILTARAQPIDYQSAIEAGADDYLAKPVEPKQLAHAVDKLLEQPPGGQRSKAAVEGNLVSVLGARGGVGATTIAVNLALGFLRARVKACLIDLSPAGGQAALQLRLRPERTWADLAASSNSDAANGLFTKHATGLRVLAAPARPARAGFPPEQLARVLAAASKTVSVCVVDSAPWPDAATLAALERAYVVVLVVTPDVGAVHALTQHLPALDELGVPAKQLRVALNHISPAPGLPRAAVEKAIGRELDVVVPYEAAQMNATVQGQPLMLTDVNNPLAMSIGKLIQAL